MQAMQLLQLLLQVGSFPHSLSSTPVKQLTSGVQLIAEDNLVYNPDAFNLSAIPKRSAGISERPVQGMLDGLLTVQPLPCRTAGTA